MIQLIGLIIAVYAITRLALVPYEHAAYERVWVKMPFWLRSFHVSFICIVGIGIIVLLVFALILQGMSINSTL